MAIEGVQELKPQRKRQALTDRHTLREAEVLIVISPVAYFSSHARDIAKHKRTAVADCVYVQIRECVSVEHDVPIAQIEVAAGVRRALEALSRHTSEVDTVIPPGNANRAAEGNGFARHIALHCSYVPAAQHPA